MIWNSTCVKSMAVPFLYSIRLFSSSTKGPLMSCSGSSAGLAGTLPRLMRRVSASSRATSSDTENGLVM